MSVRIPVSRLKKLCNPLTDSPWGTPVAFSDVESAVKDGRFIGPTESEGCDDHSGRIAFFVRYGWCNPIEVDVGVPICSYFPEWIVQDGNHRLAASIYMRNRYILASVGGQLDYARKLLGVDC